MKKLLNLVVCSLLFNLLFSQSSQNSVHSLPINDIDGNSINLSSFQGKKIMFCILSTNPNDHNINELDSLLKSFPNGLKVIGTPSYELGYNDSLKTDVKNIYASKGVVITEPMFTQKESGNNQSTLFKWLTQKSLNTRFNFEVKGIWQKYFVDSQGQLISSINPSVSFLSTTVRNYVKLRL